MADVNPTLEGVIGFAEALLAAAFPTFVEKNGAPKIKALSSWIELWRCGQRPR